MKPIYGTFLSDPKGTFKIKKMAHYFYFLDAVPDYNVCGCVCVRVPACVHRLITVRYSMVCACVRHVEGLQAN